MSALESWIRDRVHGRTVVVLAVGNRSRGDDAAGPWVADRLPAPCSARVIDAGTVPENWLVPLLDAAPEVVLIVDAADHGGAPGDCCFTDLEALGVRLETTHAPSLRLLADLLERRGSACWLLGIQPASTALGDPVSPAVAAGVETVAGALTAALAAAAPIETEPRGLARLMVAPVVGEVGHG